jgi:hypothetical protein
MLSADGTIAPEFYPGAGNQMNAGFPSRQMGSDNSRHGVTISDRDRPRSEPSGRGDQFLWMACSPKK